MSVRILEKEYIIACPHEERSALLDAAEFLNGRMREIRDSGKVLGVDRIAVMVALNLANDLLREKSRDVKLEVEVGGRVKVLRERAERALAKGTVAFGVACGVRQRAGLLLDPNLNTQGLMGLLAALCRSASSGKPYLPQFVPLVARVREQRTAPAHAGDAF